MEQSEILALYRDSGALLEGHFILSSGRHSATYLQSALVLADPRRAERLGAALAAQVERADYDLVVSPALGGLIIGHEVARSLGLPFIFTERKGGAMQLRRGFTVPRGARVLVVEDVITTGGSVRECMAVIAAHGGEPRQVLAVVDRAPAAGGRFAVPHRALLAMDVQTFATGDCPLCREGRLPAVRPGSRGAA
ncbi:MAG: orotate phosphoribosyltransferase [Zetaproteobacteria bacterium]|nr:MAG: orotate phosphoribosyltransferase [Zetaproteobacteria bacterium]